MSKIFWFTISWLIRSFSVYYIDKISEIFKQINTINHIDEYFWQNIHLFLLCRHIYSTKTIRSILFQNVKTFWCILFLCKYNRAGRWKIIKAVQMLCGDLCVCDFSVVPPLKHVPWLHPKSCGCSCRQLSDCS